MVNSTCCSCGGPKFSSQRPHQMARNDLKRLASGDPMASADLSGHLHSCAYSPYTDNLNFFFKRSSKSSLKLSSRPAQATGDPGGAGGLRLPIYLA